MRSPAHILAATELSLLSCLVDLRFANELDHRYYSGLRVCHPHVGIGTVCSKCEATLVQAPAWTISPAFMMKASELVQILIRSYLLQLSGQGSSTNAPDCPLSAPNSCASSSTVLPSTVSWVPSCKCSSCPPQAALRAVHSFAANTYAFCVSVHHLCSSWPEATSTAPSGEQDFGNRLVNS